MGLEVLIIGKGAREHAISCMYEKSNIVERIIISPGNDFMVYKRKKSISIDRNCKLKDSKSILDIANKYSPDLIDVAQDDALAAGTVDMLENNGFTVFGPTKKASRIEWDKKWSREFMKKYDIPTPIFNSFNSEEIAINYVKKLYSKEPKKIIYVKATGLCEGKGALKSTNLSEAIKSIKKMKTFGKAGEVFLIEEALIGEEFSYYAISDGKTYKIFKSAQDNKTVYDNDNGDQTGGMGAISPAQVTEGLESEIEEKLLKKAFEGLKSKGINYKGILYLGGIVAKGKSINIEYNARWGDPEAQTILPSIKTDYAELVLACVNGKLNQIDLQLDNKVRVCVVGSSKGYPNDYTLVKGKEIYGIDKALKQDAMIFSAGIDIREGKFYANGGRLFSVVADGKDILEARQKAYSAMKHINIQGNNLHYRTDIGRRDAERFLKVHS